MSFVPVFGPFEDISLFNKHYFSRYRLYVISCFEHLEHLDDRPVTDHEKEEAQRLFGSQFLEKLSSLTDVFSDAVNKVRQYISTSVNDRSNII